MNPWKFYGRSEQLAALASILNRKRWFFAQVTRLCCGQSFSFSASSSHISGGNGKGDKGAMADCPKKERRTKDAQARPAKAHEERTLADAPCGARLKALSLYSNLPVFAETAS